jgi:hypothetical protein
MQILPAIFIDSLAIRRASSSVSRARARGRRERVRASEPIATIPSSGSDDVAIAGDDERVLPVGDQQQRLKVAHHLVGSPVLRQLDRCPIQLTVELLQLRLEALEEGKGVGTASRQSPASTCSL